MTKNRNAGLITWDDGVWLDKPKFTMTGFTAKRVSETKLAKEVQTETLTMWVEGKTHEEIVKRLNAYYDGVLHGDVALDYLIKRSRLRKNRFVVKCPNCNAQYHLKDCLTLKNKRCQNKINDKSDINYGDKCETPSKYFVTLDGKKPSIGSGIAGVLHAWENTDANFDDSYLFLKVKPIYGVFTHPLTHEKRTVEFISGVEMKDFEGITPDYSHYAEQVIKKAEPVFKAMGWDLSSIRTGKIQKTLEDWW